VSVGSCHLLRMHLSQCALNNDEAQDAREVLQELCEEIFAEQLADWFADESTWPVDRSIDVFCCWFDFQHHSVLVDLCDDLLINESG